MQKFTQEEMDDRDGYPYSWGVKPHKKPKKDKWISLLIWYLIFAIILGMAFSCKKENKAPQQPQQTTNNPVPSGPLDGKWIFSHGDTVFTQPLYLTYCCKDQYGDYVYSLSYKVFNHTTFTTSYWTRDSLIFDNMIVGVGNKLVTFKRQ